MRGLRWIFAILAIVVLALLAGAWLLPGMLDWNRFRGTITALATDTLGRQVRIDGPITLTLLPQPVLTAAAVTVADGAGGVALNARQLRLRVALGPLLGGRVDAQELVLRGVDMRVPWPLSPEALVLRAPPWLSAVSARIEEGQLAVGGMVFTGIDAALTTAETGTYMVVGTAQQAPATKPSPTAAGAKPAPGRSWRFTMRLTRPGGDGSAALDVSLDGQGPLQGVGGTLSGQIVADGSLTGRIAGRGPDLSQLLPAPAVPFRAEGRVSVAAGLAAADELNVELGGSPARGAVALRISPVPRLDLALTASRLDLDGWLAALAHASDMVPPIPMGIDLSAEAGQLAGGILRSLRGAFDLADGVVEVRELRAALPGDASLRLAGRATPADARATPARPARFDGSVAITAPALRTTLAWLKGAGLGLPGELPEGVLRSAGLAGHVTVEPAQIAVDKLTGTIDDSGVSGSLTLRRPSQSEPARRPGLGAGLTLDRLELDPWLPARLPALASVPATLAGFDIDLRLEAKQALLHGAVLSPLSIDAAVEAGRLTLRRLDFVVDGAHAAASGSLVEGGRIAEGRLDVQTPQAMPLAALLPDAMAFLGSRAPALWRAPASLQVTVAGAPEALGFRIVGDVGDLRLEAQPTLDLPAGKWAGTLSLRHPGAPRLLQALGMPAAPTWLGDGSLGLLAQVTVGGGRIVAENFSLTAGALHAGGTLALVRGEAGPTLSGRLSAETLPLPLPYPRAPDPLPLGLLAGWQGSVKLEAGQVLAGLTPVFSQATATLSLADGTLRLEGLTAKIGGGTLASTVSLDSRAAPPVLAVDAQVTGATLSGPLLDLPLDITQGVLDGTASLTAAGHSPGALLATLGGTLKFSVRDGALAGVGLGQLVLTDDATMRAALAGGVTAFQSLEVAARVDRGGVALQAAKLESAAGSIGFTGRIDLPTGSADLRLALRPAEPGAPEIGLHLNGAFDAIQRTPELAELARWRATQ